MKKAGVLTAIITIILGLIIISLLYLYLLYPNLEGEPIPFRINKNIQQNLKNISGEIKMFYPNMRFNHNLLTFAFENCEEIKQKKMAQAFSEITSKMEIITFKETTKENADILIGCSDDYLKKEKKVFIAGEGGPSEILNSNWYPVILKGKILLYDSECERPVIEIHEILHVLGFDHINNSDYIMYPYVNCNLNLNQEYINIIKALYSIPPKPELYFDGINATKHGSYLDFDIWVVNEGLIDSINTKLVISSGNKEIKTFDLKDIPLGLKKNLMVQNLEMSRNINEIKFEIIIEEEEYSKENNIATASI